MLVVNARAIVGAGIRSLGRARRTSRRILANEMFSLALDHLSGFLVELISSHDDVVDSALDF